MDAVAEKAEAAKQADQATNAAQAAAKAKADAWPHPFRLVGRAGGMFNIRPTGAHPSDPVKMFGEKEGMLTISGRNIPVSSWQDNVIKGALPADLVPGEIIITLVDAGQIKGTFEG